MKKLDPKNAEVTKSGIKARGSPAGSQRTVVVNESTVGKLKKNLLYLGTTVMAFGSGVGLAFNWEPALIHAAYPLGFLYLTQMLLLRLTKME